MLFNSVKLQTQAANSFPTSDLSTQINSLDACSAYWVTVAAVSCGAQKLSQAKFIDIYNPTVFTFNISLESTGDCKEWNTTNSINKVRDAFSQIQDIVTAGIGRTCLANGQWTCNDDDNTVATWR